MVLSPSDLKGQWPLSQQSRGKTQTAPLFIKTVMMLNPDIDYQEAAEVYEAYFQPLKDRAASSANESRSPSASPTAPPLRHTSAHPQPQSYHQRESWTRRCNRALGLCP